MSSKLEELKQMYSKELKQAEDTPPATLVLDSNWKALLELNQQMGVTQMNILEMLSALMLKEDMDKYLQELHSGQLQILRQCKTIQETTAAQTQSALPQLTEQTKELSLQAGKLSEKYSSLLKELEENERRNKKKWLRAILISQVCWMVLSMILVVLLR